MSLTLKDRFLQSLERVFRILGNQFYFPNRRHEVGVAVPPRNKVEMDVLIDSRAGHPPDVRAKIESLGLTHRSQDFRHLGRRAHHVFIIGAGKSIEVGGVRVWNDHQVAAIVGILVHNDKTAFLANDDEVFVIIAFPGHAAEKAIVLFFLVFEGFDVLGPPGGEESFHRSVRRQLENKVRSKKSKVKVKRQKEKVRMKINDE